MSLISDEFDSLDKVINQSIPCLGQDNPNEYPNLKIENCNELSVDYINIKIGCNDSVFVLIADKDTDT